MNSVAHVVLILRRLVNVVSTFSISQQYFSESLNNLNGPWWTVRRKIDTRRDIRNSEVLLKCKSTQISKNNLTGLGHIFSPFFQLQGNYSQADSDPPPSSPSEPSEPPQKENDDKDRPPEDPVQLPLDDPNVKPSDIIHQLLVNPALYDPLLPPRYPIVLCHGIFSIHYF